ncbi:TPA: transposase [Stenotrophomonas maltophilia]|nr:transposase [Stenotrophomonas maltophilia]HDS1156360.1 transposase [Stenotrophomonas maltophilia]HDS1164682.1 transposase [Stenotrophomonas maltophilia]HDS1168376.1 transposase [Stenotrophomonas maltophilia]HDS1176436.1 transposase [Stenotrophomonas maltophilia]
MRKLCRRSGGTTRRSTGQAGTIKVNNGSELADKVLDRWAYENGVELDFSRRGTPTDNAMVESFNGRLRQECLNEHWFLSLAGCKEQNRIVAAFP